MKNTQNGFTLLIAILVAAVMLSASVAIANIAFREVTLSISARDSNRAFFAADLGVECATYWDLTRNIFSNGGQGIEIKCGGQDIPTEQSDEADPITFSIDGSDFCAVVELTKIGDGARILSRGYNTACDEKSPKRLERALLSCYDLDTEDCNV